MAWIMWIVIAVGLGIAELFILTFDLALLAVAAMIAAAAAAIGVPTGLSFVVFAVMAAVLLGLVRPVLRRYMLTRPAIPSGAKALVGREALVLDEVSKTAGLVKIGGEEWTARPYDATLVIPAGSTVYVFAIEGATALVHPQEEDTWASNL